MTTTDERMLEALVRALRFEDDGVAYYEKAMKVASNRLAVDVLRVLRDEEIKHKAAIIGIHDSVKCGSGWKGAEAPAAPMPDFVSVFRQLGGDPPGTASEDEAGALDHALEIEARGRVMYEELRAGAATAAERRFYELLGLEEGKHVRIIEDSLEYFRDPEGWFRRHEHSTLDGG